MTHAPQNKSNPANRPAGKQTDREIENVKAKASPLDRLALWITERVGTMVFFLIIFTWTVTWLLWNIFAPKSLRFDPFPGFVLWLFISNMIQLFLMPLIMIGQNLQGRGAEQRAKNDYQVNLRAERRIEQIHEKLESILQRLDHPRPDHPRPDHPQPDRTQPDRPHPKRKPKP